MAKIFHWEAKKRHTAPGSDAILPFHCLLDRHHKHQAHGVSGGSLYHSSSLQMVKY